MATTPSNALNLSTGQGFVTFNGTATISTATGTNGVAITDNSGVPSMLANSGTPGFVLTANSGAPPSWQASASGMMPWTEVTGTSQAAAVNNGYIANNAGLVTVTLPGTAALGTIVHVVGKGTGLWALAANTGQTIHYGSSNTTTAGSLTATNRYDAVQVLCTVANTEWTVTGVSQGNLTVA